MPVFAGILVLLRDKKTQRGEALRRCNLQRAGRNRSSPVAERGVVSHAGTVLLAELADRIGLTAVLSEFTYGLGERRPGHDPGRVLVDVAVAITDGAVSISDVQTFGGLLVVTVHPADLDARHEA